jgi:hypothetical protein
MLQMVERGIRGGISMICKRFASANNVYLSNYDPKQENSFIVYLDVNNLYGYALSDYLPQKNFQWVDSLVYEKINWVKLSNDSEIGYFIECDLEYPSYLHESHNDFPLAAEKLKPDKYKLSEYQNRMIEHLSNCGHRYFPIEKLLCTLKEKNNYVLHYRNLKFYLNHGLILKKIHRVLQFRQSRWLKPFIDLNTELRQKADNKFEQNFYKLMINSFFGKSIEQKRKHRDIRIALTEAQIRKWLKQPHYKTFNIIDENKVIVEMRKSSVYLNKPIYLGMTCLELSKLHMYQLYYDLFQKIYDKNVSILFMDTDSFCFHIKTKDIFEDFRKYSDILDLSEYPENHFSKLLSDKNKKVLGMLKDEMKGSIISEFVGIKSKMYSLSYENKNKITGKGIQRAVLEKFFSHDDYKNCVLENDVFFAQNRRIESKDHQLQTVEQTKLVLTPFDDKRFYINNVDSLAYGHTDIEKKTNNE